MIYSAYSYMLGNGEMNLILIFCSGQNNLLDWAMYLECILCTGKKVDRPFKIKVFFHTLKGLQNENAEDMHKNVNVIIHAWNVCFS